MAGLNPDNIRLDQTAPSEGLDDEPVQVVVDEGVSDTDTPEMDDAGNILRINHPDGSVTVSIDGNPLERAGKASAGWFDNLVDEIDGMELSRISEELLRGIRDDMETRKEWIEDRATGLKLLGLKLEVPGIQGAADGAPVEGMSKVRHPLLLEAVLRFQANARSELLPTDGPVKIRNDSNTETIGQERLADSLEKDLNHYLTAVATEYYPDTDRMLFMLGFGGTAFKKVYYCPLRNRPVSETVDADDLIVNNAATDLSNAKRITHRVYMRPSTVKRLQILGVYKDMELSTPKSEDADAVQREKNAQQGISMNAANPDDRDREIYECYCELDIKGFEHKNRGRETGLEIPYRVTIDASSREILSIVRNYDEDTKELPEARDTFVKYTFTPGLGFYDIGLLHILGNTTNAITAAWRELLDAGMYSNFPGFLFADVGARQNTNIFRVPPGGGAPVKTGGMPINQAIMPLPYKEPSQALMALVGNMAETGMRIGGTGEQQVGEGRADAPVGTTLAMIDQATKVLNAVHKRLHAAQAREFQLLARCFQENPESFWKRIRRPAYAWDEQTFLMALSDADLVPQADPNTASHTQRVMKIMALKQLQQGNPTLYDPIAIDRAALQTIGWNNPEQFMAPPSAQGQIPPELQKQIAEMQIKKQDADTKSKMVQIKAAETQAKVMNEKAQTDILMQKAMGESQQGQESQADMMEAHAKMLAAQNKHREVSIRAAQAAVNDESRDRDRESRERMAVLQMAKDILLHPEAAPLIQPLLNREGIQ
jgi:hypothetical protein